MAIKEKEKEKVIKVLDMSLYDILNGLGLQMEENKTQHEEIIIRAFNSHTKRNNILTVTLQEE